MANRDTESTVGFEVTIPDILNNLKEHIVFVIVAALVGLLLGIVVLMNKKPQYKSSVTVWVKPIQTSSSLDSLVNDTGGKISTEIDYLKSRKVLQAAFDTLDLLTYSDSEGNSYEDLHYNYDKNKIDVDFKGSTDIVTISVTDGDPDFAADFANAIANEYIEALSELTKSAKVKQQKSLERQIPENMELLEQARKELLEYSNEYGTAEITAKMEILTNYIAQIQLLKDPLKIQKQDIEEQIARIGSDRYQYKDFFDITELDTIYDQYVSIVKEYYYYVCASTPADDRLLVVKDQMITLTREIYNVIQPMCISVDYAYYMSSLITLNARIDVLLGIEDEYKTAISSYQETLAGLAACENRVQLYQSLLLSLTELLEQTKVIASSSESDATLVDVAIPSYTSININKTNTLIIGLCAGIAIAIGLIVLMTALDKGIYSEGDVKKILGDDIQPIGWIPYKRFRSSRKNKDSNAGLLCLTEPGSMYAERYRILAANISLSAPEAKVIVFNSMGIGNGKSTVLANVACNYASMGKRVLVVDGDLRRPQLERIFNLKKQTGGIASAISGESVYKCIVRPVEKLPNLHLLPAGRSMRNPNIVYNSAVFADMIKTLRDTYDYIFIDCPPLSYGSDFLLLSKNIDAYAIIVRAGVSDKMEVASIIPAISEIKAKLLGFIFYGVLDTTDSAYNYGYNRRYGYNYGYRYHYSYSSYDYGYGSSDDSGKKYKRSMYAHLYREEIKRRAENSRRYGTITPVPAFADGTDRAFGDVSVETLLKDVFVPGGSLSAVENDSKAQGKGSNRTK